MTPEQTKSAYQRVCEQECEGCADELPFAVEDRSVHLQLTGDMWPNAVLRHPCTAPSKDALIERHAAQIAARAEAEQKRGEWALERLGATTDDYMGLPGYEQLVEQLVESRATSQRQAVEIEELRKVLAMSKDMK